MSREYIDIELAQQLRAQGHTMKFIADYMGVSRRVLYTLRKRGEIEIEEKRVYVGRQKVFQKNSIMRNAAKKLGFQSIHEMMRHYRLVEKKTYEEIGKITGVTAQAVRYWIPSEIRGQYISSKDGIDRKREAWKRAQKKINLQIFNGQHVWQRHSKTSMREVSISNFEKAKERLFNGK